MKLSELKQTIKEDWGSSDWRPVMDEMKRLMADHDSSIEDAAAEVAQRWYEDMGYNNSDDAVPGIIRMYKIRNKITEVRMETKGKWNIQNMSGVMKTFVSADSNDARAWMRERGTEKMIWDKSTSKWMDDPKIADREIKKQDREWARERREEDRANKPKKVTNVELDTIYHKVEDAVGQSFPDGDPIDHFSGWLRKNGFTMDDVDAAFKKNTKSTYYQYLANMWDDHAGDRIADAKNNVKRGGTPDDSPFYKVEDGKVNATDNPWK